MTKDTSLLGRVGNTFRTIGERLSKKSAFSFGNQYAASVGGVPIGNIRISTDSLYTVWRNHGDVFSAIRELTENAASNGYSWQNADNPDKDPDLAQVAAIEQLFTNSQSLRKMKKRMVQDVYVSGNAYFLIQKNTNGKIIALAPIDPRTLYAVTNFYGVLVSWIQRVGGKTAEYQPDEIVQWRLYHDPNSPVFGLSPLEPIIWEVRTDLAAMVSNYTFFQNDAVPAVQYILDESLTDEESKRAMEQIRLSLQGAENRHKSMAMKGVKEIKQLSLSQKDMEFSVLRRFTTEKVCSALGVPKSVLNYTDGVNYSSNEGQERKFWEGTIAPLNEELSDFINKTLLPAVGITGIKIKFNERKFDTEDSIREDVKLGLLTINEGRQKRGMDAYDPNDAGEYVDKPIIFQGVSAVPVTDVGVDPQEVTPIPDQQAAQKEIKRIEKLAERFQYGRSQNKN